MQTHKLLMALLIGVLVYSNTQAQQNVIIDADALIHGRESLPTDDKTTDSLFFFDRNNLNLYSGILKTDGLSVPQIDSFGFGGIGFGRDVYPMGHVSFAQGAFNYSRGDATSSFGVGNINYSLGGTVLGILNDPLSTEVAAVPYDTMPLLSVGNGDVDYGIRHNALTVFYNGKVEINQEYTLPNTDGTDGQVLSTDGLGNVSWENDSGIFESDGGVVKSKGPETDDFVFGSMTIPADDPLYDTLFFYDAGKGAFRTGALHYSNGWSPDSIGLYSFASGLNVKALGYASNSIGRSSTARGDFSVAAGYQNTASGTGSFAAGVANVVNGYASVSLGVNSINDADYGMSWGYANNVRGDYASAWGFVCEADTIGSTAWGKYTHSSGIYSTAWGYYVEALGQSSTAWGSFTNSIGENSTAWGAYSDATGKNSTAWGDRPEASGANSTAWGSYTEATNRNSTSWGRSSKAIGENSTAWGHYTEASGEHSTALGFRTQAKSFAAIAMGIYNEGIDGNDSIWVATDPLLEVGMGTGITNRENALSIRKDGTISFKDYTFPNADGTNGQALKTDGSGQLTWQTDVGAFENHNGTVRNAGSATDDFVFGFDSLPGNGISYTANMFAFDESNGAFRAGGLTSSTNWQTSDRGQFSIGLGQDPLASGDNSLAIGNEASATATSAVAIGTNANSSHEGTLAIGTDAASTSIHAVAIGRGTSAEGNYSLAMGNITTASGVHSSAFGWNTIATADFSTTSGQYTNTSSFNDFVIGRYNIGGGSPTTWVDTDPLFEIGNGTGFGVDAANALTVLKNGKTGIGTHTPDEALSVVGTIRGALEEAETNFIEIGHGGNNAFINADGTGNIDIRHGTQNIMTLTPTQRVGIKINDPDCELHIKHANSGSSAGLKLQNTSVTDFARFYVASGNGHLRLYSDDQAGAIGNFDDASGVYSATSDRRLKENFEDLRFDWDSFMQLQALMYEYKSDEADEKYIGMIAQDVMKVYPEVVTYDEEEDIYRMNYDAFGVIAIKAIQEQQRHIAHLESELKAQQEEHSSLEARLTSIERALSRDSADE